MLLTKLNAICEEVKCSLTDKKKSENPAPINAEQNKSLSVDAPKYFNDKDDTKSASKPEVPKEFAKKYRRGAKKS